MTPRGCIFDGMVLFFLLAAAIYLINRLLNQ